MEKSTDAMNEDQKMFADFVADAARRLPGLTPAEMGEAGAAAAERALRREGFAHQCTEACRCPVHGTPLFYWPAGDDHACQDVDCRYGHGFEGVEGTGG
jgi:hypothetical protein